MDEEYVVIAAALFCFELFKALDECVAHGYGKCAHDVAEDVFACRGGENACGVCVCGGDVVAERKTSAFWVLLACG